MATNYRDIYAGIATIISGILTIISTVLNIPILQSLFTFVFGGMVSYFFQMRIQDRAEKRKIAREIIDRVYYPLSNELQEIKEQLITSLLQKDAQEPGYYIGWQNLKINPEFLSLSLKLREEIDQITLEADELNDLLSEAKNKAWLELIKVSSQLLQPHYAEKGSGISGDFYGGVDPIQIVNISKTGNAHFYKMLIRSVILGIDVFQDVKAIFPNLEDAGWEIRFRSNRPKTDPSVNLPLTNVRNDLTKVIETTRERLRSDKTYLQFMEKRDELHAKIERILRRIEGSIREYIPVVEIP